MYDPNRISRIALRTKIMLANTAGTLPIIIRAGIGKGLLVRPTIIVVQSVPRFCVTIRGDISTAIGIWKTTRASDDKSGSTSRLQKRLGLY